MDINSLRQNRERVGGGGGVDEFSETFTVEGPVAKIDFQTPFTRTDHIITN